MSIPPPTSIRLPPYISPVPQIEDPLILQFCQAKGVFDIPEDELVLALLESYFDFINPFLPLFDRVAITKIVNPIAASTPDAENGETTLNFLIFRALLFAGSGAVDISVIHALGFSDRSEARRILFHRARYFYDFDLETDGIILLQSLLLFTLWVQLDDARGPWHWICAATSYAQAIDLCGMLEPPQAPPQGARLLRRLWWCCYIREASMALGMKCSPSFKPAGFQLPILNVEDLGVQASPTADILAGSQPSTLTEPHGSKQMTLAMISVEFARLCIIFCKIPSSPREVGLSQHGEALRIANGAGVDSILATAFRIRDCAAELSGWYKNLPAQVRGPDTDTNNVARGDTSVDLNQGLLQMSYFTAITDLYLPQVLLLSNNAQPLAQKLNKFYRRKLLGAAMEIARVAEYFTSQRLTHYLPSYSLSLLLRAMVAFLFEFRRHHGKPKKGVVHGASVCLRLLTDLQQKFENMGSFLTYFGNALRGYNAIDNKETSPKSQHSSPGHDTIINTSFLQDVISQKARLPSSIATSTTSESPADQTMSNHDELGEYGFVTRNPQIQRAPLTLLNNNEALPAMTSSHMDSHAVDGRRRETESLELLLYSQLADAVHNNNSFATLSATSGQGEQGQSAGEMMVDDVFMSADEMHDIIWPLGQDDSFIF